MRMNCAISKLTIDESENFVLIPLVRVNHTKESEINYINAEYKPSFGAFLMEDMLSTDLVNTEMNLYGKELFENYFKSPIKIEHYLDTIFTNDVPNLNDFIIEPFKNKSYSDLYDIFLDLDATVIEKKSNREFIVLLGDIPITVKVLIKKHCFIYHINQYSIQVSLFQADKINWVSKLVELFYQHRDKALLAFVKPDYKEYIDMLMNSSYLLISTNVYDKLFTFDFMQDTTISTYTENFHLKLQELVSRLQNNQNKQEEMTKENELINQLAIDMFFDKFTVNLYNYNALLKKQFELKDKTEQQINLIVQYFKEQHFLHWLFYLTGTTFSPTKLVPENAMENLETVLLTILN